MKMINPFKVSYENIQNIEKIELTLLICSTIWILLNMSIKEDISIWVSLSALLYTILIVVKNIFLYKINLKRRCDFVDNSFWSKLWEERSEWYFSNDNFEYGFRKAIINCFENCFFTFNILKKMFINHLIIQAILMFVLLISILYQPNTIHSIIHMILPINLFLNWCIFLTVYLDIWLVYKDFRWFFSDSDWESKHQMGYKYILDYEWAISWWNILLSKKAYDKLNPTLSKKWEKLKKEYWL